MHEQLSFKSQLFFTSLIPVDVSGKLKRQTRKEKLNRKMKIDIAFNLYTDANGSDPDSTSPTLRSYHKMLWSKKLPNGEKLELTEKKWNVFIS
jgi:hypothetical protein